MPAEDLELVTSVLAPSAAATGTAVEVVRADRTEIDRFWAGRSLRDSGYAAQLRLLGDVPPLVARTVEMVFVQVENLGDAHWPWGGGRGPEIRLSYRWVRGDGTVAAEGLRAGLPAELAPGGSEIVPLGLAAPDEPGAYRLVVDLVHEHVRWFGAALEVEVEVRPRRLTAVLDPGDRERLLSVLEQLDPDEEPLVLSAAPGELARTFAGKIADVPAAPASLPALLRLVRAYKARLVGATGLLVPAEAVSEGRRPPLVAAVAAARMLGIPARTTAGTALTVSRVLRRALH